MERYLPLGYLTASILLVAILLPTALRPPQPPPPTSAQFDPNAPPDENPEVILSELSAGRSVTAGASKAGIGSGTQAAQAIVPPKPRKGKCYGNPPRQLESLYSPPCAPAFTGDNGGATWRGVSGNDIKVGFLMALAGNAGRDGERPAEPESDDNDVRRTYRVLRQYFNQSLELYGRQLRFFYVNSSRDDQNDPARERSAAERAVEQYGIFAAINETSVATLDELTRRGVVTFTLGQMNRDWLGSHRPYAWSATPDSTGIIELGAEYLCKKLANKPPKWTDDKSFDYSKPRVFGIISYQEGQGYEQNVPLMKRLIKEQCNADVADSVEYGLQTTGANSSGSDNPAQISSAVARMKAAGVTTVISLQDFIDNTAFTQAADDAAYYPEWYIPGFGGIDVVDFFFQTYSPTQWNHAFGISVYEVPTIPDDRECDRAYHSIDPNTDPDNNMCYYMWHQMVELFGAMQLGGPKLTPESIQRGLYAHGHQPPNPQWKMAGGYGPGDWTYPDYAAEIWYDPFATHVNGRPGAYHYLNGGHRYKKGEFNTDEPAFFKDKGITQAPRAGG
jgi:hypothetical protein